MTTVKSNKKQYNKKSIEPKKLLTIMIDETKRQNEVIAIKQSDFFQNLKSRIAQMRLDDGME
jgi:hypothetical protein